MTSDDEKTRKRISIIKVKSHRADVENDEPYTSESNGTGPRFGTRHVQAILLCLAMTFGIATRTNFSVAIVAMTDNTTSSNPDVPTYQWNNTSVMLSAFFWSYVSMQVIAGYLGKTYGVKYILLATFFSNCCITAAIPLAAAKLGSVGVIVCRVIQGFCQGFLYPSVNVMLGTWVPYQERATINSIVFSGVGIGTVFSSLLTGYVSASPWGWPYSFYILAICGIAWCILWIFLAQNSPATHPMITAEEKRYIQSSLKQEEDDVHIPIPWTKILTSVPFYAILCGYFGHIWGYAMLMTEAPTYLANVMDFDVKSNAIINAIPVAIGLVVCFAVGPLSDWLISRNYLTTLNSRRLFQIVGCYGQAACLMWLAYIDKSVAYLSIVALSLGQCFQSMVIVGANVNHLDLSPRFSGIIFGILNAAGQLNGVIAPLAVQAIVTDLESVTQWRLVFYISTGFYIVGSTLYAIFTSTSRQPWDGPESNELQKTRRKRMSVVSLSVM